MVTSEEEKKLIEDGGLAGIFAAATLRQAQEQTEKEAAQKALGHKHPNVLGEYVKRSTYKFGIETGRLSVCSCGATLVLKSTWANGAKIKVKKMEVS